MKKLYKIKNSSYNIYKSLIFKISSIICIVTGFLKYFDKIFVFKNIFYSK